ncbi:hypothetical protein DRJ22_05350 [Candidatus Woesearchaeota archaeon]|nr:MAG: hypothetical protein DRJ22_05350 [Candidatus Woesearchaeota archaeon]
MWSLLIPPLIINFLSIIEISTINKNLTFKQIIFSSLGVLIFFLAKKINIKKFKSNIPYIYAFFLSLLFFLLFKKGISRWFKLSFLYIQPSEFAKLSLILTYSYFLEKFPHNYKTYLIIGSITLLYFIPTALQPDLGTALIFIFLFLWILLKVNFHQILNAFTLFYAIGSISILSKKFFLVYLIILIPLTYILLKKINLSIFLTFSILLALGISSLLFEKGLKPYQKNRIRAFFYPEKYSKTYAWQSIQSKIAIGSGGLIGKGIGKGTQKGLAFLPAAHTDFIFSAIVEEMGFFAGITVILLILFITLNLLNLSEKFEGFGKYFLYLSSGYFFMQSFINIGCALGLLPPIGIPLIFSSYGGSHTITEFLTLGFAYALLTQKTRNI